MKTMKRWMAFCCAVVLLMGMVFVSHATTRSLSDYIDVDSLTAAYFFDSNLDAAYGTTTATANGTVEYVDGYNGKAVYAPGTSYVSTDVKFSEKSFSIALWINRGEVATGDPFMYGNQNWNNSRNTGFAVPMAATGSNAAMAFSYQPASVRIRMKTVFSAEKLNQWVHTLLVIDRENNVAKYYEDFQYVTETSIADLGTYSLDSGLPFTIGHEPTASYKYSADLTFDDLLVFDHAVTAETIGNLKNYYYTPAESVTLNKTSAELQVNQGVALTATTAPEATLPRTTAWSSDNTAVATVDENGVVKAVAPGTAVITATVDGKTASCDITVTAAPDRKIYEHVVVVGIDGAGDFFGAETPNIDSIFANGAYTKKCLVTSPSISAQNWSTCMTGVTPNLHEVTNDTTNATPYTKDEYPTFFKLVRESYPDYMISTFCTWQNIDIGCIEDGIGVLKGVVNNGVGGPIARDAAVKKLAVEQITEESPNLLYLHFNTLDSRGHEFGYGGTMFKESAVTIDGYVGEIYAAIQANDEMKDNTLFIVTADHGGTNPGDETGGSHGDWSDVEKYVFFGAVGTGVNQTDDLQMRLIDTAAIVTYALNAKGNPVWDSYVPKNLFTDYLDAPYKETLAESVTAPTPTEDEATYIGNFVDTEKLEAAIFFDDGKNTDLMGNVTAENVGAIYYTDGYYGHGVELSCDGYISIDELTFGTESFSIGLWVNRGKIYGDPALYGNQDWTNSRNTGFTFPMRNAGLAANMAFSNLDEAVRIRMATNYDEENYGQWVHTLLVVDRETQKAKYYENFQFVTETSLESLGELTLDSGLPFNLGQDGTGEYCNNINAEVDDLLVYNCAVTEEDIADLQTYYSFRNCQMEEHTWGEYVYNQDATIYEDGTETAKCTAGCGATDTRTAEGTKLDFVAGDVDGDRQLSTADVVVLMQYLVGRRVEIIEEAADYNADGEVSIYDAVVLLRAIGS
ncbi:MAG: alkaline phosphatase family protein [Clostridia bacterium]|nr:alkaline phosphatase family protein [Clostridia bacterium]